MSMDERERRELAERHRDEIDVDSARAIEPRALDQILSVRMPAELAIGLRDVANRVGVSVSDLLRAAARQLAAGEPVARPSKVAGWRCEHMSITSLPGALGRPTPGCGCHMQPIAA